MTYQLSIEFDRIFDAPRRLTAPYARNSATSKAAAKAVEPRIGTQKYEVLQYLKQCGKTGATDEELALALCLSGDTVRPRRGSLADAWLICKQGTRKTTSGRDADIWVAV